MIEDVAESTDMRTRRHFGALIKAFAVNREQHCHGKKVQALTLTPLWRVTMSLNDEPERLLVLPPLNEDIADKVMLLKVRKRNMPMSTNTPEQMEAFWNALMAELPAFLHFLQNWEIPADLQSPRFGITHCHHPELVAGLADLTPEQQLLEMIDQEIFHPAVKQITPWVGSALEVQKRLTTDTSVCQRQAQTLLHSPVSCGTYLSRLEKDPSNRVTSRRINGRAQ